MEYSQDDFWLKRSHGFDFDTADVPSISDDPEHSVLLRNKPNRFNLLRYTALDEIVENSLSPDILSFDVSPGTHFKFAGNSNPLLIFPNEEVKIEGCVPEKTVISMILGLKYSLSEYKSKKDKLDLLNATEKTHDGSTILEVVLHLRNTFKKAIFQRKIADSSDVLNVYLAYLEENREFDELNNMLLMVDKTEDAAFQKYEVAVTIPDSKCKLHKIENCLSTHFQLVSTDTLTRLSIEEHCRILKEQIEFLKSNLGYSVHETEMTHFEKLTGKKSVIDSSVMSSLIYCCLFYYKSEYNSHILTSPLKLATSYNLTNKQFTWSVFRALASLQKWSDIDNLFLSKNWLGRLKIISRISPSRILDTLFKENAPTEVITKYVSCVENGPERLNDVSAFCRQRNEI